MTPKCAKARPAAGWSTRLLRNGAYYPWDHQPLRAGIERYMRNHMDLNVLEETQTLPARGMRQITPILLPARRKMQVWGLVKRAKHCIPKGKTQLCIFS